MNIKRFFFWLCFVVLLGLIVWGLIVANNRPAPGLSLGEPAPVTSTDHVLGSADAKVTLVEYADFQCPACALYDPIVKRLYLEASTTLRIISRHFPLTQHNNAMVSAYAVEAAEVQGKYWEMSNLIYANQTGWSDLPETEARQLFVGYAGDLGLDTVSFSKYISAEVGKQHIADQLAEGVSLGVNATPTFFVNGKAIRNPQGYDEFKAIIDAAAK